MCWVYHIENKKFTENGYPVRCALLRKTMTMRHTDHFILKIGNILKVIRGIFKLKNKWKKGQLKGGKKREDLIRRESDSNGKC